MIFASPCAGLFIFLLISLSYICLFAAHMAIVAKNT